MRTRSRRFSPRRREAAVGDRTVRLTTAADDCFVDDVATLIATLGEIHDRCARAAELVDELRGEVASMPRRSFTFAVPIWKKPWMWCGSDTYVARLVEAAGGINVIEGTRYPHHELAEVLAKKPDVVFLPDERYVFTPEDAQTIDANVIGPFSGHLFTWHGTRTILGLRFLRERVSHRDPICR